MTPRQAYYRRADVVFEMLKAGATTGDYRSALPPPSNLQEVLDDVFYVLRRCPRVFRRRLLQPLKSACLKALQRPRIVPAHVLKQDLEQAVEGQNMGLNVVLMGAVVGVNSTQSCLHRAYLKSAARHGITFDVDGNAQGGFIPDRNEVSQ